MILINEELFVNKFTNINNPLRTHTHRLNRIVNQLVRLSIWHLCNKLEVIFLFFRLPCCININV